MLNKRCTDCKQDKPLELFNKDRSRGDGLAYRCKECSSRRSALRYLTHRAHISAKSKRRYHENKEARSAQIAKWQSENANRVRETKKEYRALKRDARKQYNKKWAANNRDKLNARDSRRRAALMQATPAWADNNKIQEIYSLAKQYENVFGGRWSVDHIVPLRSKLVCGLHVETNLRILPLNENKAKGNRRWPEMP